MEGAFQKAKKGIAGLVRNGVKMYQLVWLTFWSHARARLMLPMSCIKSPASVRPLWFDWENRTGDPTEYFSVEDRFDR